MKKTKLLTLFLVLSSTTLLATSCGGSNGGAGGSHALTISLSGPTTVEVGSSITLAVVLENDFDRLGYSIVSSDPNIATVDDTGKVTGVSVGEVTITVTSRKDETVKKEYQISVISSSMPSVAITLANGSTTLGADVSFKATVNNPNNLPVKLTWGNKYGKGTFVGNGETSQLFRAFVEGSEVITLEAQIGGYTFKQEANFYIKPNYNDGTWTPISTKDELTTNILKKAGTLAGKYYLANDIDLEGYGATHIANSLTGVLDGRGHKIYNYQILGAGETKDGITLYNNGGLIATVEEAGVIRNLSLDAEIPEKGSGWGSAALVNVNKGLIENVYLAVDHSFDSGKQADKAGWIPFVAGIAGTGSGTIRDTVVNVADTEGKATLYADIAYPSGGQGNTVQSTKVTNFYTNTSVVGGQVWDWGYMMKDQTSYHVGINFANAKKETYNLNETVWNIQDSQTPSLKVID